MLIFLFFGKLACEHVQFLYVKALSNFVPQAFSVKCYNLNFKVFLDFFFYRSIGSIFYPMCFIEVDCVACYRDLARRS